MEINKIKQSIKSYSEGFIKSWELFFKSGLYVYAGATTLYLIVSLFPFILMVLIFIQMLPGFTVENVIELFDLILPDVESMHTMIEYVVTTLRVHASGIILSVSIVFTLWSASAGISSLQAGLVQMRESNRPWVMHKIIAIIFTVGAISFIPLAIVLTFFGKAIVEFVNTTPALSPIASFANFFYGERLIIVLIVGLILHIVIYMYLPGGKATLKSVLPGSIVSTVFIMLTTRLFSIIIVYFNRSAAIYGQLSSVFFMVIWIRILICIIYYGACINRTYELRSLSKTVK
ncbi:MAG: YihY/virulence factor BrkB family protein [Sphaerochaetaceae bacterium]|nr:YihY/virulence factor BrkB family protein [Sphaerochaetaceae bacterium]